MTPFLAKLAWGLGVIGWFIIRYPHQRRSGKTPKARISDRQRELVLMSISTAGLFLVPLTYVVTGWPRFASYTFNPWQSGLGVLAFAAALWLFRRTHKELGRQWSVTLEVREQHKLITDGLYGYVRHPMYSAFWLWAIAQALLLPNWIAGFAGLAGVAALYFCRVGAEEEMMRQSFGDEYRVYAARTGRIIPRIF